MSKKNKKSTKRSIHANDLQRGCSCHLTLVIASTVDVTQQVALIARGSPTCVRLQRSGEKLAAVKKQLKVQKQEKKTGTRAPGPSKPKIKRKGIRLRKGISVKVAHHDVMLCSKCRFRL